MGVGDRGYRYAQPPATVYHPCRDGVVSPWGVGRVVGVGRPGVSRCSNPGYDLSSLPGCGQATRKGCQTVAGGRSNAETSGQRLKERGHPDGVPEKVFDSSGVGGFWSAIAGGIAALNPGYYPEPLQGSEDGWWKGRSEVFRRGIPSQTL